MVSNLQMLVKGDQAQSNFIFNRYKSKSQIARILSEGWLSSEMYCPCCLNERIEKYPNNKKASDFFCQICGNEFQAKSARKPFGRKVLDGEYYTMMSFIQSSKTPNFFFMRYSPEEWIVKDLTVVPKFFVSASAIEKRKPISIGKEREGWIGCNILMNMIPEHGRIIIIRDEKIVDKFDVNTAWKKMAFLNTKKPNLRGWTADVLKCIEELGKHEFRLDDLYKYEESLKQLHQENQHIKAKIRQQLQILRDNNIISFNSRGNYSLIR